jgi:hypothetical protein
MSILQLMPNLPMNKIQVEISAYDSNNWIYIPKPIASDDRTNFSELDMAITPSPLSKVKTRVLSRSVLGCFKVPLNMNERIIESGLKVLERNQEQAKGKLKKKTKINLGDKEKTYQDEIKEWQDQQGVKIEKIERKLDQIMNQNNGFKIDNIEKKLDQIMNQMKN